MDLWGKKRKIFCFCLNPALDLCVLYSALREPALGPHAKEISPGQLHFTGSCGNLLRRMITFVCIVHVTYQVQQSTLHGVSHETSRHPEAHRLEANFDAEIVGKD